MLTMKAESATSYPTKKSASHTGALWTVGTMCQLIAGDGPFDSGARFNSLSNCVEMEVQRQELSVRQLLHECRRWLVTAFSLL